MKVVVAGAGIAGLTCAAALARSGVAIEVIERNETLTSEGAGISLFPNALAALDRIGIEAAVTARGEVLKEGLIQDRRGRTLAAAWSPSVEPVLGGLPVMVHRGELHEVLLDACRDVPVHHGAEVSAVLQRDDEVVVQTTDGREFAADVVVGADGWRSAVRQSVCPGQPRYSGLTAWRAVIPGETLAVNDSWLSVGSGRQFLATALTGERTYHSGLLPMPPGALRRIDDLGGYLRAAFDGWHEPIAALVEATPEDAYLRTDVYFRPPPTRLSWGNVVLIGDASHPITPDLGQGGCQAIEDAVVLAACLANGGDMASALSRYERIRLPRIRRIAARARQMGRLLAAHNPGAEAVRNAVFRSTPRSYRAWQLGQYASRRSFLDTYPLDG